MRILVDNSLSPQLATLLNQYGHDAVHLRALGLADADDEVVFKTASNDDRTLLSADSDFGKLLALGAFTRPSVIYFRNPESLEPKDQAAVLLSNLAVIEPAVISGSIVVIRHNRLRIRQLPIDEDDE